MDENKNIYVLASITITKECTRAGRLTIKKTLKYICFIINNYFK